MESFNFVWTVSYNLSPDNNSMESLFVLLFCVFLDAESCRRKGLEIVIGFFFKYRLGWPWASSELLIFFLAGSCTVGWFV